jgi:CRISPR-associated protein Cas1
VEQISIEDIGVLILENSAIVLTQPLIIECQKNTVAIIFCDEKHLPYSTILPIANGNTLHQKILKEQINITEPIRKNIWKQIIVQKVQNQANTLKKFDKNYQYLQKMQLRIKSGDSGNIESLAARYYWKELFGKDFIRDQEMEGVNACLNYGYGIIRATVARAIVTGGLHPAIGVFHHNQYNGLCLADDIMEPFRPWVDEIIYNLFLQNQDIKVSLEIKKPILNLLSCVVKYDNKNMPLMIAIHYLIAELKRNFNKESKKLIYPKL